MMRRLLVALGLVAALASPAAGNTRLAVILNAQAGLSLAGFEAYYLPDLMLLRQLGVSFDVYDANKRTWGSAGVADSTWFRQRYGAVWLPYLQSNANRGVNAFALNFQNAAGSAGWDKSPITGKWSIPVYVKNSVFGYSIETDSPTLSNDSLRFGVRVTSRAMSVVPESLGTWRDRSLSRLRPGRVDTLYNRPGYMTVRSETGKLGQYVAAVTWLDTTHAAVAADTILTTWRYKPLGANTPGAVYTLLDCAYTSTAGRMGGALVLAQLMLTESTVKARRRIPIAFTIHHAQPGRTPDADVDNLTNQVLNAHERAGLFTYAAMKLAPSEWPGTGTGGAWTRIRRHMRDGWMVWHPHSHDSAFDYNESDSVGMRIAYNAMLNTAVHRDSFGLSLTHYDPRRMVPANDLMTRAAAATAVRAGMRTLEVVLTGATTGADRFSQPAYVGAAAHAVPGEPTRFWTRQSFDLGLQGDFATFKGSVAFSAAVRSMVSSLERSTLAGNGVYWHMDALVGNTAGTPYTDPFNAWIIEHVIGSWLKQFSAVVECDRPQTTPKQPSGRTVAR